MQLSFYPEHYSIQESTRLPVSGYPGYCNGQVQKTVAISFIQDKAAVRTSRIVPLPDNAGYTAIAVR
jgi:hypothetical protein